MKTKFIALLVLLLVFPISMFAQSEHLTFKGIPINGTLDQFTTQLTQKGFTKLGSEKGQAVLKGNFAGYKDCCVLVSTLDQSDLVYMTGVMFPDLDKWGLLENNYYKVKEMLITKYGKPKEEVEEFQSIIKPRTDSEKLHRLKFDECTYKSVFETEKGHIVLTISHDRVMKCYVLLGYVDGINGDLAQDAALDDL